MKNRMNPRRSWFYWLIILMGNIFTLLVGVLIAGVFYNSAESPVFDHGLLQTPAMHQARANREAVSPQRLFVAIQGWQ